MTTTDDIRMLGKYRLLAKIGEGGMASIYLAVVLGPAGFNKLVVIKELLAPLTEDPEHLAMFLDEARLAARLNHPNVAQTHEIGSHEGRHYLAMEYLDGQPLNRIRRRLASLGSASVAVELRVVSDALAGLHYAHNLADYDGAPLQVVHRDMSPHNVVVTYEGQVKVLDFGIAKTRDSSARTKTGILKGKIGYMAPEQARGEPLDRRSDVYAAGVMLWEGITGKRMWKGLEEVAILHRILLGDIPSARSVNPDVPEELDAICRTALANRADERFATAAQFRDAIEAFMMRAGMHFGHDQVGDVVARAFVGERQQMAAIIDEQLRMTRAAEDPASIPKLVGSGSFPSSTTTMGSFIPTRHTPSLVSSDLKSNSIARTLAVSQAPAPVRTGNGWVAVVASASVAAVVAVGITIWLRNGPTPAPVAPAAAPPEAASAPPKEPAPPAMPTEVELRITTKPSDAKLFLDGKPLAGSPFEGRQPRDDRTHMLRVEAQGFEPKEESVVLDRDLSVLVVLERARAGSHPGAGAGKGAATAKETDTPFAAPGGGSKQNIDPDNPYGNKPNGGR